MNNKQIVAMGIQGYSMSQIADLCNVAVEEVEEVCFSDPDYLSIEFGFYSDELVKEAA